MNSKSTILILVAAGLFYTFTNPIYQETKQLRTQVSAYKDVLQNAEATKELRDSLQTKYKQVPAGEVARLNKVLPPYVDNVRLALDLDTIASRYGVSIGSVDVKTQPVSQGGFILPGAGSSGSYNSANVTFSFTSSYSDFKKFMADIEKSLRIIDVESLGFEATENGIYNYSLTVNTYWLDDSGPAVTPGAQSGQAGPLSNGGTI